MCSYYSWLFAQAPKCHHYLTVNLSELDFFYKCSRPFKALLYVYREFVSNIQQLLIYLRPTGHSICMVWCFLLEVLVIIASVLYPFKQLLLPFILGLKQRGPLRYDNEHAKDDGRNMGRGWLREVGILSDLTSETEAILSNIYVTGLKRLHVCVFVCVLQGELDQYHGINLF